MQTDRPLLIHVLEYVGNKWAHGAQWTILQSIATMYIGLGPLYLLNEEKSGILKPIVEWYDKVLATGKLSSSF